MPPESLLPYHDPQLPIEQRVSDLLARMTLEEKLAQLSVSGQIDAVVDGKHSLDQLPEFAANGVGAVSRLGLKRTPADTVLLYNKIQQYLVKQTRLGIPAFAIDEALHGLMAQGSTFYPQAIGLASTWNPDLVRDVFTATAAEMRARGGNYALTPVLDLARDPRWGRTEETYGEDPHLVSRLGVAAIRGLQGDHLPDRSAARHRHGQALCGARSAGSRTQCCARQLC